MNRVVITGATGVVGMALIRKCIEAGTEAVLLVNPDSKRVGRIPDDPLVNFTAESLDENLNNSGFSNVLINVIVTPSRYSPNSDTVKNWFINPPAPDQKTMKERFLDYFEEKKVDNFISEIQHALSGKEIEINSKIALIQALK